MAIKKGVDLKFLILWDKFVVVLESLVVIRARRPGQVFLESYQLLFKKTFAALREKKFSKNLELKWAEFEKKDALSAELLTIELQAFIRGYERVTGAKCIAPDEVRPPSIKDWSTRRVSTEQMLEAGKALLGGIVGVLGNLFPGGKTLLKVLGDALEVANA
ncbi:MAG: hypothetical protein COB53_03280 [Elusimicrobia bacterium]|nr:MAG: hypothetical protein COB53_03280 [Elusimicrobiota bacterium]